MSEPSSRTPYAQLDLLPIGRKRRHGSDERVLQDRDPYSNQVLIELPQADRNDLQEAFEAAQEAQPAWAGTLSARRAHVMRRAADIMVARRDEILTWLIREAGSTRAKARMEWSSAHAVLLEAAGSPYLMQGRILPSDVPGKECRVYRKPVGVVGVISPWNWPLHLSMRSVAIALAVGNAVVLKPASDTPVSGGLLLSRIFEEAGLPQGVLSVLVGSGSELGDPFVTHPAPRVISFTGSTPVGRRIAKLASEAAIIKRVDLELGGNAPFVVLEDADLERAVEAAVFGKFLHQGQICIIANRLIVDARVHDAFVERFVARVRGLKCGDPNDEDTFIGPIINRKQLDGLLNRIEQGKREGARQLLGSAPQGLVLPPHVFVDVRNEMSIARNELFGPVAPILRVQGEEEALRVANETEYGLSSCVFTRDVERGTAFALRLQAGMAHVNDQPVNDLPNNPFGGEKNSGIGRFGGEWAVDAFTTEQWVTVQHTRRTLPFGGTTRGNPSVGG